MYIYGRQDIIITSAIVQRENSPIYVVTFSSTHARKEI